MAGTQPIPVSNFSQEAPLKLSRKPKWLIVYEALERGHQVEIPGHQYKYVMDTTGRLCWLYGAPGECLVCDMPLNDFVKMCERINDGDIISLAFNSALTKFNDERRSKPTT